MLAIGNLRTDLIKHGPTPAVRQFRQIVNIRCNRFRIFTLPPLRRRLAGVSVFLELRGFPFFAALSEDAFEQFDSGFGGDAFGFAFRAPLCGEPALNRSLEHRRAVALEVGLRALECSDAGIEV